MIDECRKTAMILEARVVKVNAAVLDRWSLGHQRRYCTPAWIISQQQMHSDSCWREFVTKGVNVNAWCLVNRWSQHAFVAWWSVVCFVVHVVAKFCVVHRDSNISNARFGAQNELDEVDNFRMRWTLLAYGGISMSTMGNAVSVHQLVFLLAQKKMRSRGSRISKMLPINNGCRCTTHNNVLNWKPALALIITTATVYDTTILL